MVRTPPLGEPANNPQAFFNADRRPGGGASLRFGTRVRGADRGIALKDDSLARQAPFRTGIRGRVLKVRYPGTGSTRAADRGSKLKEESLARQPPHRAGNRGNVLKVRDRSGAPTGASSLRDCHESN